MDDSLEDIEVELWCDYCQRGKSGYPSLPDDIELTDLGGVLICDGCDAETITAVAQYDRPDKLANIYSNDSVWLYYRDEDPPPTEMIHGAKIRKRNEYRFDSPVNVPAATETIEELVDEESVTLVPPFDE
jgi:hypothetical protein